MELKQTEYNGYQISNDGRVWSHKSNKFLKPSLDRDGYLKYGLSIGGGKVKTVFAHRLVAQAFIPNPDNLPQINHKDENKLNNNVENLEWCSAEYNNNYGTHNKKMSETKQKKGCTGKAVIMCDKTTEKEIKQFVTASEAAIYCGQPGIVNGILQCSKSKKNYKTALGYKKKNKK